jgi:hypothetical protein
MGWQYTVDQLNVLIHEFQSMSHELEDAHAAMRTYTEASSVTALSASRSWSCRPFQLGAAVLRSEAP